MEQFYLGLDGGGTSTKAVLMDEGGTVKAEWTGGPLNCNSADATQIKKTTVELLRQARDLCSPNGIIGGICIGAAGISNPAASQVLMDALRQEQYENKILLSGDHEVALAGGLGCVDGMILISGTGSVCCGVNSHGHTARCGGWGHLIDDKGSGYDVGIQILGAVVRAQDGRGKPTCLTALLDEALGGSTSAHIVSFTYSPSTTKKEIAGLAPLLKSACEQGDVTANAIALDCAMELASLVDPVASELGLQEGQLLLYGGMLTKDCTLRTPLEAILKKRYPRLAIRMPQNSAAYGAALLAHNEKWVKR